MGLNLKKKNARERKKEDSEKENKKGRMLRQKKHKIKLSRK